MNDISTTDTVQSATEELLRRLLVLAAEPWTPENKRAVIREAATELTRAREREKELAQDAERYRYLRNRPEDTIGKGGVFAGMTPPTGSGGHILTEEDLDRAVDRALAGGKP